MFKNSARLSLSQLCPRVLPRIQGGDPLTLLPRSRPRGSPEKTTPPVVDRPEMVARASRSCKLRTFCLCFETRPRTATSSPNTRSTTPVSSAGISSGNALDSGLRHGQPRSVLPRETRKPGTRDRRYQAESIGDQASFRRPPPGPGYLPGVLNHFGKEKQLTSM